MSLSVAKAYELIGIAYLEAKEFQNAEETLSLCLEKYQYLMSGRNNENIIRVSGLVERARTHGGTQPIA